MGVGVDVDGDFAGIGETTGALANGDGDSGDCEGAGGLVKGDGEISDPGADAGDPDGTSDMCGVMATGDGPGAPVGASLNGDGAKYGELALSDGDFAGTGPVGALLVGDGANVGVSALGGEDFTGTSDGPGASGGEPLGVLEIGAGETGDNDGPRDEAGGSALGDGDFEGAGDGLLCAPGDGALGDIAGGCDTGVGACFGLAERTTTVSFCPFRQLSSFPLMKK